MEKISFVIPVYNEEGNLVALCDEIRRVAATLGRLDGQVTRDEAIAHCAALTATAGVPRPAGDRGGRRSRAAAPRGAPL